MYEGLIMLKGRLRRYIAVILSTVLIFGGCTKDNSEDASSSGGAPIILQMRPVPTLNPLLCENQSVRDALSLCYEPLFSLNGKMLPEGELARNISVTDDCMSAVITLKDSVLWHDGVRFTSADVVHTINLLKNTPNIAYKECVEYIESARSIDPLSLKLELSRPYGQIAWSLYFPIVPSHNCDIEEGIMGTGAYMLEKYTPSVSLELKRNENWHKGAAQSEKVMVSFVRDRETATTSFNSGMINAITNKSFDLENKTPRANARTTYYPSTEYEFIGFNHRFSLFGSFAVRNAVSSAIDRSAIVKECYASAAEAANSPLHPASEKMAPSVSSAQYNLANAREMLFLEGYSLNEKTGLLEDENEKVLSFTLLVNSENQSRVKCARLLETQLYRAGIKMNIREESFENYSKMIQSGNYEAYLGGTKIGNILDFEFLLSETGTLNNYGYTDEYMQLALLSIAASPSEDALSDAVANFEEIFLRQQPVCGLVFKKDSLITAENVMGKLLPQTDFPYKNIANWSVR